MTGLYIQDSAGKLLVDMTSKISQNVGFWDTNGANGSIVIPLPPAGKQNYYIVVPLVDTNKGRGKLPGVTLTSQQYLNWVYSYDTNSWGNFSALARIYYGYY